MSSEKMIFVTDKYISTLEKGDMISLPFQVIRDLDLKKGDRIEFEYIKIEENGKQVPSFTIQKHS